MRPTGRPQDAVLRDPWIASADGSGVKARQRRLRPRGVAVACQGAPLGDGRGSFLRAACTLACFEFEEQAQAFGGVVLV